MERYKEDFILSVVLGMFFFLWFDGILDLMGFIFQQMKISTTASYFSSIMY